MRRRSALALARANRQTNSSSASSTRSSPWLDPSHPDRPCTNCRRVSVASSLTAEGGIRRRGPCQRPNGFRAHAAHRRQAQEAIKHHRQRWGDRFSEGLNLNRWRASERLSASTCGKCSTARRIRRLTCTVWTPRVPRPTHCQSLSEGRRSTPSCEVARSGVSAPVLVNRSRKWQTTHDSQVQQTTRYRSRSARSQIQRKFARPRQVSACPHETSEQNCFSVPNMRRAIMGCSLRDQPSTIKFMAPSAARCIHGPFHRLAGDFPAHPGGRVTKRRSRPTLPRALARTKLPTRSSAKRLCDYSPTRGNSHFQPR